MDADKKKNMIDICLNTFVAKGLVDTSSRDLGKAMNLQSGGLYYYFSSKDEAVIACAEAAALNLEEKLIIPALKEVETPEVMMRALKQRADEMAPMMKFLAQVCSMEKYRDAMLPVLGKISKRYEVYANEFAKKFECELNEIMPFVYMCITAVSNYMIFGEEEYITPQTEYIKKEIKRLVEKSKNKQIDIEVQK
jgi:AcrR family transcriptional regulator